MKRINQFDYLKAMAIILVIITHISLYGPLSGESIIFPYLVLMAVPIFMIISGYMNSMSFEVKEAKNFRDFYGIAVLGRKLKSILFPFTLIFILELIFSRFRNDEIIGIKGAIRIFITGGLGPGSYYIPVLVQMIFIAPLIYLIIKKSSLIGSILVLTIQLLLEYLVQITQFSGDIYRLLILRYLVFLLVGTLLYKHKNKVNIFIVVLCMCIGAVYIWQVSYEGYVPFLFRFWTTTAFPTVFWAGGIVIFFIKYVPVFPSTFDRILSKIGSSTFYIYLVQMVYFQFGFGKCFTNPVVYFSMTILICVVLGLLFGSIQPLLKKLKSGGLYENIK